MDTTGVIPQLTDDDPLYQIADYTQLMKTKLEPNMTAPAIASFSAVTWGALLTAPNLVGKNFKMLHESFVFGTDASGYAAITMPYSFISGYHISGLTNGDDLARPGVIYSISTGLFTNTFNKFYIRAYQGTTPVASATVRMNYIAVGY